MSEDHTDLAWGTGAIITISCSILALITISMPILLVPITAVFLLLIFTGKIKA